MTRTVVAWKRLVMYPLSRLGALSSPFLKLNLAFPQNSGGFKEGAVGAPPLALY